VAAVITKYLGNFFEILEVNVISTEVQETSAIELISIGLAKAFAGVKVRVVAVKKRAFMETPNRNNLRRTLDALRKNKITPL
jgi:hypothetical protein